MPSKLINRLWGMLHEAASSAFVQSGQRRCARGCFKLDHKSPAGRLSLATSGARTSAGRTCQDSSPTVWPLVMRTRGRYKPLGRDILRRKAPAGQIAFSSRPRHLGCAKGNGGFGRHRAALPIGLENWRTGPSFTIDTQIPARVLSALFETVRAQPCGGPCLAATSQACSAVWPVSARSRDAQASKGLRLVFCSWGGAPVKQEFKLREHGVILAGNPRIRRVANSPDGSDMR